MKRCLVVALLVGCHHRSPPAVTCSAPTPIRDPSTNTCVACLSDTDCTDVTAAHCNAGQCVQCTANSQCGVGAVCNATWTCQLDCRVDDGGCPASAPICAAATGACVQCVGDSECTDAGSLVHCVSGACAECASAADCPAFNPGCSVGFCGACGFDTDCPAGQSCSVHTAQCECPSSSACGSGAPVCVGNGGDGGFCGCRIRSDCGGGSACDPGLGLAGGCVAACGTDAGPDCGAQGALCSPVTGLCVSCLSDSNCSDGGGPHCTPSGVCGACGRDADCDGGFCSFGGICVQCTAPAQCPAGAPGCNSASWTCGSCEVASDCPSLLFCDVFANRCRASCDAGCSGVEPLCGANGLCVQCLSSADCPDGGACDPNASICQ